jgi:hypothetical protein
LLAPVVQSTAPVGGAVKTCTAHTLTGGTAAFVSGSGAPKKQPMSVHVLSLVVCVAVAAPRIPRGPSHPTIEKIARVWSGGLIGSGAEFPPPPRYRPKQATLVTPDVAMMSPQSPGVLPLTKPKKPSPLQQMPPGAVVAVVLVVDVVLEENSHEGTHVKGAPSLATRNVRALLGFGTTPPLPPQ